MIIFPILIIVSFPTITFKKKQESVEHEKIEESILSSGTDGILYDDDDLIGDDVYDTYHQTNETIQNGETL